MGIIINDPNHMYSEIQKSATLRIKRKPRIYDPLFFNTYAVLNHLKKFINLDVKEGIKMVDIGCGIKPYESLFPKSVVYIGVDVVNNENTDIVAESWSTPIESNSVDVVISTFSLEHISHITETHDEINRILKKEGYFFVAVPFVSPEHEMPWDYWRFTKNSLNYIFSDFELLWASENGGYFLTLAILNNLLFQSIFKIRLICGIFFLINNSFSWLVDVTIKTVLKLMKYENCFYYSLPYDHYMIYKKYKD